MVVELLAQGRAPLPYVALLDEVSAAGVMQEDAPDSLREDRATC